MMKYYYSKFILLLILSLLISIISFSGTSENKISKAMVVIIDPGHGGKDPGAVSKGIREKDVVLAIGLKLGKLINENFPEVKLIFTRNTDVFVPLIDRSKIANKNKADLFISIHANFCGTPSTRGTETYFLGEARTGDNLNVQKTENSVILLEDDYITTYEGFDPNSPISNIIFSTIQSEYLSQSLSFAWDIQRQFHSRINSSDRGPKQAGFLVLRMSAMPSVLVETGFISNPSEAIYLSSNDGQRTIAQSIFEAFKRFKTRNTGTNTPVIAEAKSTHGNQKIAAVTEPNGLPPKGAAEQKQDTNMDEKPVVNVEKISEIQENKTTKNKTIIEKPAAIPEKDNTNTATASLTYSPAGSNTYYSVQIGANTTPLEPVAANFKGLRNVRREKNDKYYRYYVGKETSLENIEPVLRQIKVKFSQAFIVSFVDGKRIIINADIR